MFEDYHKTRVTARLIPVGSEQSKRAVASMKKVVGAISGFTPVEAPDLTYCMFVLASEKENTNGDYFSRADIINAKNSPAYKPFNVEHKLTEASSYITAPLFNKNENTTIGHIVHSAIARKDGTVLTEKEVSDLDMTEDPNRNDEECLDIVCGAVLYSFYFPKTVSDLLAMASDNTISVSMECWFKDYDFLVGSEIIKSSASNADMLTAEWRAGKKVEGRRVSRVLKDFVFGGVGATTNPANEESVFVTTTMDKLVARHQELHLLQKYAPSEKYVEEHEELERLVASIRGETK